MIYSPSGVTFRQNRWGPPSGRAERPSDEVEAPQVNNTTSLADIQVPNFKGFIRAEVITNVDPLGEGRVGVRIRKISCDNMPGEAPVPPSKKETLQKSAIDNKDDNQYKGSIPVTNYQWARPVWRLDTSPSEKTVMNDLRRVNLPGDGGTHQKIELGAQLKQTTYNPSAGSYGVPRVGTTIWVIFEDDDPLKLYYLPWGPSITGQVTPMQMVEQADNKASITRKPNIDVIREWHNGTCMYYDTNDDKNCFAIVFQNGHRLKFEFNSDASGIVLNTQGGHIVEIIDKSSREGDDNPLDYNDQDGFNHGHFIRLQTKKGHRVLLDDNDNAEKVHVRSYSGLQILLDDVCDEAHVWTVGGSKIDMIRGDQINMTTGVMVSVKSGGMVNVETPQANVTAEKLVNVNAPEVNVTGAKMMRMVSTATVAINAPQVLINSGVADPSAPPSGSMMAAAPAMGNGAAGMGAAAAALGEMSSAMAGISSAMSDLAVSA
jgi:hypothetical protein